MCEFIDFSKFKIFEKKEDSEKVNENCQTIPIELFYVNKYLEDATAR